MDFWRVLGERLSFGTKKRKRDDCIHTTLTSASPISTVFANPPVKVNDSFYTVHSPLGTPTMEVLFFHGLQFRDSTESHLWTTWESRDGSCIWPEKWMGEDFQGAKIMFVSYDGDLRRRTCNSSDLYIIIENLISDILQDNIGQMPNCPVIMVGHCFGGMVIKQLCLGIQEKLPLMTAESEKVNLRNVLDNVKGIFYYDTPHHGIAGLERATHVKNDPLLTFFQILGNDTERLNCRFNQLRGSYKWHIHGLGASLRTKLSPFQDVLLVPESFGREGDHFNVVEEVDHYEICKPRSKMSRSFYALKYLVNIIARENSELLAGRISTHNLMEGSGGQTLALLPFNTDHNYVPVQKSIQEIQSALEDAEGQRVITLYGGPGLGKSSVVKYLALYYQEEKKQWLTNTQMKTPTFPGGVYYLHCGQEAHSRIKQLQLELIDLLGYGAASAVPPTERCAAAVHGESFQLALVQRRVQCHSVEQQSLIILDDVWEQDVVERLLVHAQTVKYLITSQYKGIWGPSKKIKMKSPTMSEARQIMATYTEGLPKNGEFPDSIQNVTDAIIEKVEHHPLSLAYIGISINSSRATDARPWKAIDHNIQASLDESDVQGSPVMYNRRYSLTVSASMMLMVDSLRPEARELFFLIALLGGGGRYLPESLVRFFHKFLRADQRYYLEEKYLEDRSLIELHTRGDEYKVVGAHSLTMQCIRKKKTLELHTRGDEYKALGAHSLTMQCIREKKTLEVLAIASQILPSSNQLLELIKRGDSEEMLVIVLSAMYFTQPFTDILVKDLIRHLETINGGIIARNINNGVNALQLVHERGNGFDKFVPFITAVDGEPEWKRKAHAYGKKIILKLAYQGKLDDCSMAGLLQIPETISTACEALSSRTSFLTTTDMFSSAHPETMKALLALVHDNATSTTRQVAAVYPLLHILYFERKDTILRVGTKWTEVLAMDSNPVLQIALIDCILEKEASFAGAIFIRESTKICEVILGLWLYGKDDMVRECAERALEQFCMSKFHALEIASIPGAIAKLFNLFLSKDRLFYPAGIMLARISCALENKCEWQAIKGGIEGVADIVAKVKETWQAAHKQGDRKMLERQAVIAAQLIGELALDKEVKNTIISLPRVEEGLLFLQAIELIRFDGSYIIHSDFIYPVMSTRALVLLYSNTSDGRSRGVLPIGELEVVDEGFLSEKLHVAHAYVRVYWTQVLAYFDMGDYRAALENLDLAKNHLDQVRETSSAERYLLVSCPWYRNEHRHEVVESIKAYRDTRMLLLAMLKDREALVAANMNVNEYPEDSERTQILADRAGMLMKRGFVKRLRGDLQGALDDLNVARDIPWQNSGSGTVINRRCLHLGHRGHHWYGVLQYRANWGYHVLSHRSYVKYLMEDELGAREDAEFVQQVMRLKHGKINDRILSFMRLLYPELQPVNYLGYSL